MTNAETAEIDVRPTRLRTRSTPLTRLAGFGRPPRVMGVDVARGVAVLGMIGAHIGVSDGFEWLEPRTWGDLVHGRSSIVFALLAGVSLALLTRNTAFDDAASLRVTRLRLVGRGLVILGVGVALELLGTNVAVILPLYGVLFVLVIPLLGLSQRALLIAVAVLVLAGPLVLGTVHALAFAGSGAGLDLMLFGTYPATVWIAMMLAGLAIGRLPLARAKVAVGLVLLGAIISGVGYGSGALLEPLVASAQRADAAASSAHDLKDPVKEVPGSAVDLTGEVCEQSSEGALRYLTCRPVTDESSAGTAPTPPSTPPSVANPSWMTGGDAPGNYWRELMSRDWGPMVLEEWLADYPHSGGTPELLGSGGLAIAILGVALLLTRRLRWLLIPLAAVGSMPLTAYSAHVVIILFAAGTVGLQSDNTLWGAMSLALMVACTAWVALFGKGPLERLTGRAASAMALTR